MRFAGTAKQYSANAIPQLTSTTIHSGRSGNLSCPYQAKVMKTLETERKTIGATAGQVMSNLWGELLSRSDKCSGVGGLVLLWVADWLSSPAHAGEFAGIAAGRVRQQWRV